jgi:TfoX/Sxy family transcriptional regulator of competence genes
MAYSEELADRIRDLLIGRGELSERKMFGGIAFMLNGNMTCGVIGDELMARVGAEQQDEALTDPHARVMDFTGKPMKGMIYVSAEGVAGDADLDGWVDLAAGFTLSLPAK